MFDIELAQRKPNLSYDLAISDGDFKIEYGLETALVVCLLSDRRADNAQVFRAEHRRGWICDLVATRPGYKIGSHIWLLEQERLTQETLTGLEDAAKKALEWMLNSGLIKKIEASAALANGGAVLLSITLTSLDESVSTRTFNLWKRTLENAY